MTLKRAFVAVRPLIFGRRIGTSLKRGRTIEIGGNGGLRLNSSSVKTTSEETIGSLIGRFGCSVSTVWRKINIWRVLKKLGIPNCRIVAFRRATKKMYYSTGLATIVKGAFPIIVGDLLAQTVYPYLFEKKNKKNTEKISLQEINWCRTSHFAVVGAFLAPIAKRWNLFWGRRIRRYPPGAYMTRLLLLDAFLLTPAMVFIYMIGYDFRYFMNSASKMSDKGGTDKLQKRYETPLTDMVLFYITTKPLVAFAACFILPCALRNVFRRTYTFLFYCFVSHTIVYNKLGPEITKRKAKRGTKGKHYDGGGGFVCMLFDKLSDGLRSQK